MTVCDRRVAQMHGSVRGNVMFLGFICSGDVESNYEVVKKVSQFLRKLARNNKILAITYITSVRLTWLHFLIQHLIIGPTVREREI